MEELRRERLLDWGHRVRTVKQGPDGLIYLLLDDDDGSLIKIEPAD
jgi:glucose/arabinose dehydrogenase